jgi:hypothetical protein
LLFWEPSPTARIFKVQQTMHGIYRRSAEGNSDADQRVTPLPLRAELIGSDCATAPGIDAHGSSPLLALCRKLVDAGHDPATPLLAYRGNTLALKVRSIGEGAKLTVEDDSGGKPIFRRWRDRRESSGAASPVATRRHLETPEGDR